MENIDMVKDMDQTEKDRWVAEVKVLKAYYHFYLLRMYGPIPLIRENLPIASGVEEVQVAREPFDNCVDYIRSEEHTSELQSLMRISYAVFCLKKKKKISM